MSKPSIPKGTRDFLPKVMVKRNYIFNTIKQAFVKYGFLPIETPCMENLSTLTGKYGEEGDRLIFKVLDRGDKLMRGLDQIDEGMSQGKIEHTLCKEALRYDLTVPFARFVVQHQNELSFPFKRYQIQPVWRADRPAKARYREFYQCDADVVGSDSLLFEVELIQLFDEVLSNLGLNDFSIKVNNRKILSGIAEITGLSDKIVDITVAIDKLDKIGEEGVIKELERKEIPQEAIEKIKPLFKIGGNTKDVINEMRQLLADSEIGLKGIDELAYVFEKIEVLGLEKAKLEFDVTLARGLNYYTGAIFEVKANNVSIGSICGGGRYDDLTGIFGLKDLSGVGISFGADRIYDVMEELNLFPETSDESTQLLLINFGVKENECLKILQRLREDGINTELYPEGTKLKKQMKYADSKGIPFVLFLGEEELESGMFQIKNLQTGDQKQASLKDIIADLS
ncbi:histidine--tRNA ligase [Parvicella tangerina]|uniref:Histidine--tRNA ligase n=1 Tax=Parvicella tangerina TaxID=2829795 RepID=A0A916NCQ2_9FLAO|nr:histidine--tRNA ligase [Parvicella tangerina]CAG5083591.1 Histidine--tRNA ligase [Parvicella tangerina]